MNECVYISDELHNECIIEQKKLEGQALLYLVGKRKLSGVWVKKFALTKYGGCPYTPGATTEHLSKVLIQITKERLSFAGVIKISPHGRGSSFIRDGDAGDDLYHSLSNVICVSYVPRKTIAELYKGVGHGATITINVVSKKFKPNKE
jgi:hypothetical protein